MYSTSCYSQDERWDSKNYIYSNFQYGFSWTLPNDVTWDRIVGTEKHTVFKIVQPDTNITVFVNANKIESNDAKNADIWKVYDTIVKNSKKYDELVEKNTGIKTISHTFEKCIFCGQHAYKAYHHGSLKDDRYDEPLEIISLSYSYAHNGYTFSVTIKSYKFVYDEVAEYIKDIFKGYTIVNKYY